MPHAHVTAAGQHAGASSRSSSSAWSPLPSRSSGRWLRTALSLLADAGHLLTDVVGIGLALLAIWFAGRPPTLGRTFGYLRLEIIAAVANAILLFGVAGYVVFEAVRRYQRSAGDRRGRHVRRRAHRPGCQWRVGAPAARRAALQPQRARGVSRGARRPGWVGRRDRRGDRHRADRLGRRRHDRVAR